MTLVGGSGAAGGAGESAAFTPPAASAQRVDRNPRGQPRSRSLFVEVGGRRARPRGLAGGYGGGKALTIPLRRRQAEVEEARPTCAPALRHGRAPRAARAGPRLPLGSSSPAAAAGGGRGGADSRRRRRSSRVAPVARVASPVAPARVDFRGDNGGRRRSAGWSGLRRSRGRTLEREPATAGALGLGGAAAAPRSRPAAAAAAAVYSAVAVAAAASRSRNRSALSTSSTARRRRRWRRLGGPAGAGGVSGVVALHRTLREPSLRHVQLDAAAAARR